MKDHQMLFHAVRRARWIARLLCCLTVTIWINCTCENVSASKGWNKEFVVASRCTTLMFNMFLKNTSQSRLRIPSEKGKGLTNDLSIQDVSIEVKVNGKWRPASLNPREIYGDIPINKYIVVEPDEITLLTLRISSDMYLLSRGQRVRIRVAAWREDREFKKEEDREWLLTKEFLWP